MARDDETAGTEFSVKDDSDIIQEAKDRYKRAADWTADARKLILEDLKFSHGDSDNGYQWPNNIKKNRDVDARPTLTINQVRQHNLQIINDAKQHKPGIMYRPTGNGATYESAQALQAVVRHIEQQSKAEVAYDTATDFQVNGGLGWIKVSTRWANDESFDQDIFIERVTDPLSILIDPEAKEADRSDAKWAFIFEDMDKDEAERLYPEYKDVLGEAAALNSDDGWLTPDKVRFAEYFRQVVEKDKLVAVPTEQGTLVMPLSRIPEGLRAETLARDGVRTREVDATHFEWFFIVGNHVMEAKTLPGKYIPLVPVIGEEIVLEGKWHCSGHTRALKDPQRMYNYWTSAATEHIALQGKSPWIAPNESIEEYEDIWNNANNVNYSVLPYKAISDDGQVLPPPQRVAPPQAAPAYIMGMQTAKQELMFASGQYEAMMGEQSNERTGKAINERQRQGETATYHYIDNLAIAIRQVGRIVLDLIPKIYDTKRVIQAIGEDGISYEVMIDPTAQKAWQGDQLKNQLASKRVLNPGIGTYDVVVDTGPNYATKREEAFNALTLILTQSPQLTTIIGDLLLKAGDFPMSNEAAERLRRMVPPQALGTGPSVNEQMLMQKVQMLQELLQKSLQKGAEDHLKLLGKDQQKDIDAYNAETQRLKLLMDDMGDKRELAYQLLSDILANPMESVTEASEPGLAAQTVTAPTIPQKNPPGTRQGLGGMLFQRNYGANANFIPVGTAPDETGPAQ